MSLAEERVYLEALPEGADLFIKYFNQFDAMSFDAAEALSGFVRNENVLKARKILDKASRGKIKVRLQTGKVMDLSYSILTCETIRVVNALTDKRFVVQCTGLNVPHI